MTPLIRQLDRLERALMEVHGQAFAVDDALIVPVPNPRIRVPEKGLKSRSEYHITILDPDEWHDLLGRKGWTAEEALDNLKPFQSHPKYVCLGRQERGMNAVYFVVVYWPEAQEFRAQLGLGRKDLHITVGYREADIHGVPKDRSTCVGKVR